MQLSRDSEVIEQEAAHWIVRRDSGTWTADDQEQFNAWRDVHVAHRIAYIRLERVWLKSERLRVFGVGLRRASYLQRSRGDRI